ncbi:serine hydrolase [Corallococcus carmarthensis]|nr:serine hydrolase [Corallococcus carmarthensis]
MDVSHRFRGPGRALARASGRGFDDFLSERLFKPLGMNDTAFSVPREKLDQVATAYQRDPKTGALTAWAPPVGPVVAATRLPRGRWTGLRAGVDRRRLPHLLPDAVEPGPPRCDAPAVRREPPADDDGSDSSRAEGRLALLPGLLGHVRLGLRRKRHDAAGWHLPHGRSLWLGGRLRHHVLHRPGPGPDGHPPGPTDHVGPDDEAFAVAFSKAAYAALG